MSDGDFLDGYREALDLMKDEFTAARARVKELERERDEARGAALWLSRRDAADAPPPFVCNVLRAARVLRGEESR
jgi:hypothetical protein